MEYHALVGPMPPGAEARVPVRHACCRMVGPHRGGKGWWFQRIVAPDAAGAPKYLRETQARVACNRGEEEAAVGLIWPGPNNGAEASALLPPGTLRFTRLMGAGEGGTATARPISAIRARRSSEPPGAGDSHPPQFDQFALLARRIERKYRKSERRSSRRVPANTEEAERETGK